MSLEVPFTYRHEPLPHQAEYMATAARRSHFGLLWEQGTGKSKSLIDNMALLACEQVVDGAFVLAPNGVHRNWHVDQLPEHWPHDAPAYTSFSWDTTKVVNKDYQAQWKSWFARGDVFKVLCMSYDGLMTEAGKKASWDFLRSTKSKRMYVADESQRIKDPGAKRTTRAIKSSVYADYRRIASGTPMDVPFDIYSQVRFLDPDHWMRTLAIGGAVAFRKRFGNWYTATLTGGRQQDLLDKKDPYRDLDVLATALADISSRVPKESVVKVPKIYKRLQHPMNQAQRTAYAELKREFMTILESGELVTAELAIVLDGKLAQITSGFVTSEAGGRAIPLGATNPKHDILRSYLEDLYEPTIIWGRFVYDIENAYKISEKLGRRPVVYDGSRPELSVDEWKAGRADDLIANLGSGMTEGYTLNRTKTGIYMSNTPRLIARQQSEDRFHRIGQLHPVTYTDLVAEGSADLKRLSDLRNKRGHNGIVLGDDPAACAAWLREALDV